MCEINFYTLDARVDIEQHVNEMTNIHNVFKKIPEDMVPISFVRFLLTKYDDPNHCRLR